MDISDVAIRTHANDVAVFLHTNSMLAQFSTRYRNFSIWVEMIFNLNQNVYSMTNPPLPLKQNINIDILS